MATILKAEDNCCTGLEETTRSGTQPESKFRNLAGYTLIGTGSLNSNAVVIQISSVRYSWASIKPFLNTPALSRSRNTPPLPPAVTVLCRDAWLKRKAENTPSNLRSKLFKLCPSRKPRKKADEQIPEGEVA